METLVTLRDQLTWNWKESLSVPWPKCRYQTAPSSTSCWVKDVVVVKPRSSTSEGRHPSEGPSAGVATSTTSPGWETFKADVHISDSAGASDTLQFGCVRAFNSTDSLTDTIWAAAVQYRPQWLKVVLQDVKF